MRERVASSKNKAVINRTLVCLRRLACAFRLTCVQSSCVAFICLFAFAFLFVFVFVFASHAFAAAFIWLKLALITLFLGLNLCPFDAFGLILRARALLLSGQHHLSIILLTCRLRASFEGFNFLRLVRLNGVGRLNATNLSVILIEPLAQTNELDDDEHNAAHLARQVRHF